MPAYKPLYRWVLVIVMAGLAAGCTDDSGASTSESTCGPDALDKDGVCGADLDDPSNADGDTTPDTGIGIHEHHEHAGTDAKACDHEDAGTGTNTDTQAEPCEKVLDGSYIIKNISDVEAIAETCEITGDLIVSGTGLNSFSLPALTLLGGRLKVEFNYALSWFSLPALKEVGLNVDVANNYILCWFSLPALTTVWDDLVVHVNPVLTSFDLSKVTYVDRILGLHASPALTSFDLPALTAVGGDLTVHTNNPALRSFTLSALTSVGGDLTVGLNHGLPQCLVDALVEQIEAGEGIDGEVSFCWSECYGHEEPGSPEHHDDDCKPCSGSNNNIACTCEEVAGVFEATCP